MTAPNEETVDNDERSRRPMDPEVRAISAILRVLDDLPTVDAKARVIGYLKSRFAEEAMP